MNPYDIRNRPLPGYFRSLFRWWATMARPEPLTGQQIAIALSINRAMDLRSSMAEDAAQVRGMQ